jgi:exodeoxyribonuclease VII small subunit
MTEEDRKPAAEMTYEEAYQELRNLVEQLETEELALEVSLELFERGQALARRCEELLESAELKLKQLVPSDAGGLEEADLELTED